MPACQDGCRNSGVSLPPHRAPALHKHIPGSSLAWCLCLLPFSETFSSCTSLLQRHSSIPYGLMQNKSRGFPSSIWCSLLQAVTDSITSHQNMDWSIVSGSPALWTQPTPRAGPSSTQSVHRRHLNAAAQALSPRGPSMAVGCWALCWYI